MTDTLGDHHACSNWEESLTLYVDGSLDDSKSKALLAHLQDCQHCQSEHESLLQLESLFQDCSKQEYTDEQAFAQLRQAAWMAARLPKQKHVTLWITVPLLAAAALLLLYTGQLFWSLERDWQLAFDSIADLQPDLKTTATIATTKGVEPMDAMPEAALPKLLDIFDFEKSPLACLQDEESGRRQFVRPGSMYQNLLVVSVSSDSVTLQYGEEASVTTLPLVNSQRQRQSKSRRKLYDAQMTLLDALTWMQRHQKPGGLWDVDDFNWLCECTGEGLALDGDLGVTGLSLLAFARAGYDDVHQSEYSEAVTKGLHAILNCQVMQEVDYHGLFLPPSHEDDRSIQYTHAMVTAALAELYALNRDPQLRESLQYAVNYILWSQNDHPKIAGRKYGWRYQPKTGDSDSSVTAWMTIALTSAQQAGIQIPAEALQGSLDWFDDVTSRATWRAGYREMGWAQSAVDGTATQWLRSESSTAMGVYARLLLGARKHSPVIQNGVQVVVENSPVYWFERGRNEDAHVFQVTSSSVDYLYWLMGTMAVARGGSDSDWIRWERPLLDVLLKNQEHSQETCADGSWSPVADQWSRGGGRAFATAINAITLAEVVRRRIDFSGVWNEKE